MRQLMVASTLFALALLTTVATGQPPGGGAPQPGTPEKKADKKADPTDVAIAAALANDPDVRMAKAKIQLAEAELAKARLATTQRVVMLKTMIEQQKAAVSIAIAQYNLAKKRNDVAGSQAELLDAQLAVQRAQAALATSEAELKLLTGTPLAAATDLDHDKAVASGLKWIGLHAANDDAVRVWQIVAATEAVRGVLVVKGPIPDRIRAALDKPVKLGAKGEKVTFEKALEVFKKEAGLDVPIRGDRLTLRTVDPKTGIGQEHGPIVIVSEGEELPVGAWFQLYQDVAAEFTPGFAFYVREYGLLVRSKYAVPPDAPSLIEFWKQKPPAKETKPEQPPK
jgi:hypothetical protein